ncbi:MAG: EVE domain-containing protein [Candidatus Odinarchaeia archaeon]
MKVLLDTNIFIDRENNQVIPIQIQELLRLINKSEAQILIHPLSIEEINSDHDEERKRIVSTKINTYAVLESPPQIYNDPEFYQKVGFLRKSNDQVDATLLYAVYRDAVNFLITEDKKLKSKSNRVNLEDRVLSCEEAIDLFGRAFQELPLTSPPAIKLDYCYNYSIDDPFFDSLRDDYPEFNEWYQRICQDHRKCWAHRTENGTLGAILIFKEENEEIIANPIIPKKPRLKISTLKAVTQGVKIGELFIKLSCRYAIEKNLEEIYLTVYTEKQPQLVSLIEEYGFEEVSLKENGESIFLKKMLVESTPRDLSIIDLSKKYYPSFYDGNSVKKFIIPIRPEYHYGLFTSTTRQTLLTEHFGEFISEGNTIKKAYLCGSGIKKMRSGDLVLFYQSQKVKAITAIGVVENVRTRLVDPDKIFQYVSRRTVYTYEEIKEMAKKPTLVILFRLHFMFKTPIHYNFLKSNSILKGPPQTITEISNANYALIKMKGELDERFTIH